MAFATPRPRPNLREASHSRDSNALRASVLEAALELGISSSRAVADLIFNTVDEEDEVRIPFSTALCSLPAFFFFLASVFFLGRLPNFLFPRIKQKLSHFDSPSSNDVFAVILLVFCRTPLRRLR